MNRKSVLVLVAQNPKGFNVRPKDSFIGYATSLQKFREIVRNSNSKLHLNLPSQFPIIPTNLRLQYHAWGVNRTHLPKPLFEFFSI